MVAEAVEMETVETVETVEREVGPRLEVVRAESPDMAELQAEARAAERASGLSALRGVLIGMPIGAVVWMGIVALALAMAGGDWEILPALGMGAAVGVFAGAFLGGWAGVTVKAEELEEAELRIVQHH
jgi:hypothetical protein